MIKYEIWITSNADCMHKNDEYLLCYTPELENANWICQQMLKDEQIKKISIVKKESENNG